MNPKRRRLKSSTIASFALISCLSLGVGYTQSTFAQTADDQVVESIANDSDAVDNALNEAFGFEDGAAEVTAEVAEETEVAQVTEETVENVEEVATVTEDAKEAVEEVVATEKTKEVVEKAPVVKLTPIEQSEVARRKAQKADGMAAYERGLNFAEESNYEKAVKEFQFARTVLEKVSKLDADVVETLKEMAGVRASVYEDWAKELVTQAKADISVSKYSSAVDKLTQAKQFNPEKSEEYQAAIDKITKASKSAAYIDSIKAKNVDPGKEDRDTKEKTYFEQAKLHYRNGRFEEAKKSLQSVLRLNPYNRKATYWLNEVEKEILEIGRAARKRAVTSFKNQVEWAWVPPLPKVDEIVDTAPTTPIEKEEDDDFSKMKDKLDTIIIKTLDLNEATINEVVQLLIEKSVFYDEKYKEGVNIILDLGNKAPAKTAPVDDFGGDDLGEDDFGGEDEFAESGEDEFADDFGEGFEDDFGGEPAGAAPAGVEAGTGTITFSFKNMPLGEVIKYVCRTVNLKWRVDKHAILIAKSLPITVPTTTRIFNVRPGFVQAIVNTAGSSSSGSSDSFEDDYSDYGGGDTSGGGGSVTATPDALKAGFKALGVEFVQGTQVSYNGHISKLIVTHSAESLNKVQALINELDTGRPLVNITAKFVEVGATDISELGMEWMITNYTGDDRHIDLEPTDGDPIDLTSGISKLSDFTTNNILTSGAGDIFESYLTFGDFEFKNVIRALDKNSNLDILSSPEVTTLSGEEASIKSITRRYFPESWTEPEPGNGNGGGTITLADGTESAVTNSTPSIPEFGDATELGVILTVTPTVTAGSKEIELSLTPKVSSFVGYDEEIEIPFPGVGNYSPKMPIISERILETRVICDDGETVVLGGLMKERVTSYEDRVPLLADIPLLGKLFQSEGEISEKTNLLVFVTAQLVDSTGRPMRRIGEQERTGHQGLPTFDF